MQQKDYAQQPLFFLQDYSLDLSMQTVWMGKEKGEQLKEIVGLVGEPSEVLARTLGDGVMKMMKKREGES